ncbi:MAG: hypothetical protein M3128_12715 [Verrucomicrobiota bacterium]|nr:hypothetical protein [Verrucomicrobiota bacterium]
MRLTNKWLGAACASLFFLGAVGCRTTHKDGARAEKKKAVLPMAVGPTQTGSYLPRHAYVADETKLEDERREQAKKEKKAKSKSREKATSEKRKPVDEDYVPRGGFR